MQGMNLKPMTVVAAVSAVSLGLSLNVLAGPPVGLGFNPAQEAVRMSMLRRPVATEASVMSQRVAVSPKIAAATNQKATTTTHMTGQPNQTCGSATAPETPGHAASASGSAFNPNGKAGTVYAGTQANNSKNPTSVAQYDVACSKQK